MLTLKKIIVYVTLIFVGLLFLYFSFSPNEIQNYSKIFHIDKATNFISDKYRSLIFVSLSEEELKFVNNREIFINYPQKSMRFTLADFGVSFNSKRERIVDAKKLTEFKIKLTKDLEYLSKGPVISVEKSEFYALGNSAKIEIDEENLLKQLELKNLLSRESVRIVPKFGEIFNSLENKNSNLELKNKIISKPLQLKAGRREINLTSKDLESFISQKDEGSKQILFIDTNKIENFLSNLDQKINFPADVDYKLSSDKLANHLLFRITEENFSRTFILPIVGSYSFSPQKHNKFIEVNKSQQRAYLFHKGELYKTLIISTGVTWETPAGEFKVLNKVPMTISYTNNWYMPWYLPIGTLNGGYYFGFHEVPYHMDYNGMIYSRDPETIGSPATGGCIQVLKGQAKELFDWAEVGIPVYITE
jgi:hypothetical protein